MTSHVLPGQPHLGIRQLLANDLSSHAQLGLPMRRRVVYAAMLYLSGRMLIYGGVQLARSAQYIAGTVGQTLVAECRG